MDNKGESVKLEGFAPAAGPGAGSSSLTASTTAASASTAGVAGAGATAPVATAAGGAGGGAGGGSLTPATKKPAASAAAGGAGTKRTYKKRAPKKGEPDNNDIDIEETDELRPLSDIGSEFSPLPLPQIQLRLKSLLDKLPKDLPEVPPDYNPADYAPGSSNNAEVLQPIKSFASTTQVTIEEYNLLLGLVSSATYKWGVDRSGASQQNLSVMSAELQQCQDVISNVVSARLSNVLCPAVDVLIGEVEIVRDNGGTEENGAEPSTNNNSKKRKLNEDRLSTNSNANTERRINHYTRPLVDPSYVHLCHCILARNAPLIRHTVATSIYTAQRVIGDYLTAMKKDSSHEAGKGGYY